MRPLNRNGFTLTELLISMVMLAGLATAMVGVVRGTGLVAARATAALHSDRTTLSLRLFMEEALRDARGSDVTVPSSARATLSRPIGEALPCADSAGILLIADAAWTGTRLPAGDRDDAWLLVDATAENWLRLPIDSVGSYHCPSGASAIRINFPVHTAHALFVRVSEPVELSAYRSGSADWFGLTPANHSSAVQPFAGPLAVNTARFTLFSDRLEITAPPSGSIPSVVIVPLGPS